MTSMAQYRKEYGEWLFFLNRDLTMLMVGAGIGIISTNYHSELAVILFIMLIAITQLSGKFPRLIKALRKKKRSRNENYKYHGIMKTDFGLRVLFTKLLPFSLACAFIGTVLAGMWQ